MKRVGFFLNRLSVKSGEAHPSSLFRGRGTIFEKASSLKRLACDFAARRIEKHR